MLKQIARGLRRGRLAIFPTETVYGIGALASKPSGLRKIYRLKGRTKQKPMSYHIGSLAQLKAIPFIRTRLFETLRKRFWPGPVTLLVPGRKGGAIGLRFPNHAVARQLIQKCGGPLLATSANRSGKPSCVRTQELAKIFRGKVDYILDAGRTPLAVDSTVVDISQKPFSVRRRGPRAREIEKELQLWK